MIDYIVYISNDGWIKMKIYCGLSFKASKLQFIYDKCVWK